MDELIDIVAPAQDRHIESGPNPLEENLKYSQPSMAQNRSRPNDRHVQTFVHITSADLFGFVFGSAVGFPWGRGRFFGHRIRLGGAEHRARRGVNHFGDAFNLCCLQKIPRSFHIYGFEEMAIFGQRHLGNIVVHNVALPDRPCALPRNRGCPPARNRHRLVGPPHRPDRRCGKAIGRAGAAAAASQSSLIRLL